MCLVDSISSLDLQCSHTVCILLGTGSSQPILISQVRCSKIFIRMIDGENHPNTSKVLATSVTLGQHMKLWHGSNSEMKVISVGIPLDTQCSSVHVSYWYLLSGAQVSQFWWYLLQNCCFTIEFHFRNRKPAQENNDCNSFCRRMAPSLESDPVNPSST